MLMADGRVPKGTNPGSTATSVNERVRRRPNAVQITWESFWSRVETENGQSCGRTGRRKDPIEHYSLADVRE